MKVENKEFYGIIYLIENNINNKKYIGQTTGTFKERYKGNLEKYTHNRHLRNSIKKYGIENFTIREKTVFVRNKEELDNLEKDLIAKFNTMDSSCGYNKNDGGSNGRPSEEIKKKISDATKKAMNRPEVRKKISDALKGDKHPNYNRTGVLSPMYGRSYTEVHRKKMSDAKMGALNHRAKKVIMLDRITGEYIKTWDCISDASLWLNKKHGKSDIVKCCKGKLKQAFGYRWCYLERYNRVDQIS